VRFDSLLTPAEGHGRYGYEDDCGRLGAGVGVDDGVRIERGHLISQLARCVLVALLACTFTSGAYAQAAARPRVFLQCPEECFESYLHETLSYFDFVRAPDLADLTLLIVRQPAANGGERFTVSATNGKPALETARMFTAEASATDHDKREQLLQVAMRALHSALADTPHERAFELRLPTRTGRELSVLEDPWDYWVLAPELKGSAEGESGYYWAELTGALTMRRITDASKLRLRGAYTRTMTGYHLDDDEGWLRGNVYRWEARGVYALSIDRHWALGPTVVVRASEFENLEAHVHGGPLLEVNLFPYVESQTRQLRAAYQVGAWYNDYFERNVGDKTQETRAYHALSLIADFNQPWGSVQWAGQVNSFIDDPELYRLSTGATITLELFQGLAIGLEGHAAYVRDLVNLRGREISDEEIILWTAQQYTEYIFEAGVSFVYTFGSIHNTVVNPRFERVDVEEE
jgi:hypothetical protein